MESIYVSELPARYTAYQSGLSALSELTMLGEPDHAIFAAERSEREQFLSNAVSKERALEEGLYEIQIMRYDFSKIICNSHIDPVTLIKSLNVRDERIEMAVSTLMEEYEWYEE